MLAATELAERRICCDSTLVARSFGSAAITSRTSSVSSCARCHTARLRNEYAPANGSASAVARRAVPVFAVCCLLFAVFPIPILLPFYANSRFGPLRQNWNGLHRLRHLLRRVGKVVELAGQVVVVRRHVE